VSLIRARHVNDDLLYDAYLTARRGVPVDPRLAEHLADCPACERRYAELVALMDEVSAAATADLDERFPADHRRAQRARILGRVAQAGRPARVLNFPGQAVARHLGAARPRLATRWIAAGAAAGLFIGVGLGLFLDYDATLGNAPAAIGTARSASASASRRPASTFSSEADEEAFLSALDMAFETPRTHVLLAYDALTPHVRDVVDIR
jgi:hypothetical protein